MGRSNGNEGGNGQPRTKVVGGVAAIAIALVCSVLGISGITPGSGNSSQGAQAVSSQTTSQQRGGASDQAGSLTFRNKDRLESHYQKHGVGMGYASAEDYLAGANAVVSSPKSLHKTEAEDGDDVYYLESTGEFVVVSRDGCIRTYYIADKDYFDRQ